MIEELHHVWKQSERQGLSPLVYIVSVKLPVAGAKNVCEKGLFGENMAINVCLSLSLSRSPRWCTYVCMCSLVCVCA